MRPHHLGPVAFALLLLTVIAAFIGLSVAGMPASAAASSPNLPDLNLSGQAHGEAAIQALSSNLPAVAAAYGMTVDELTKHFRDDPSLNVDKHGKLFYTCDAPSAAELAGLSASAPEAAEAIAPLGSTFQLHSKPGSHRVIYLDFNGGVLTGTAWNVGYASSINCPAYDTDGNASSFSNTELTAIQYMWQRVAEDYSIYDVDVTTEEPSANLITRSSSTDDYYGTRALISPISSAIGQSGGGVAYVGIFNRVDTTDYLKPALIFPEHLGYLEKAIAEACTHEVGHNLGLSHDGVVGGATYYDGNGPPLTDTPPTDTGWAPIMGVGYYRNLTQWSKGEYPNANNTEDDLAKMATYGLSYRPDDNGDTTATATVLPSGTQLSGGGIITTRTDVDVFRFSAASGPVTITCNPAERGPDADLMITLMNSAGTTLTTANPSDYLYATISNYQLPAAGTYYLKVDGVGKGNLTVGYSDYASIGAYSFTITTSGTTTNTPPVAKAAADKTSGAAPLTVAFSSSGSTGSDGSITGYHWDFGDTTSSTSANPSHTYSAAGTYTAKLTVTDNGGATGSATVTITVTASTSNQAPIVHASATPTSGYAPLRVAFSSAGSYDPEGSRLTYRWDFGDGTYSTAASPSHSFSRIGTFNVTLTVRDRSGGVTTVSLTITTRSR